ncbi:hypothetical protein MSAN_01200100 [Mycena sanguinolenta]|uniref:DUF6532 domain-containing protein n=1 Tax=Mycena sanguinolenta TaxID=230812 RepID=A0A8H7D1J6_9AGAR|nr:hypothetical protein MSAN_01200100 [Mycena sanguinolenta]
MTKARTEVNRKHAAPSLSDTEEPSVVQLGKKKAAALAVVPRSKGRKPKSKGKKSAAKSKPQLVPDSESSMSSTDSSSSSEESPESESSSEDDELDDVSTAEHPVVVPVNTRSLRSVSSPPKSIAQRPRKSVGPDEEMLDAPPLRDTFSPGMELITESDVEMRSVKSRRSSSVSSGWSSGPGVPETDYELLESPQNSGGEDIDDPTPSVDNEPKAKQVPVQEQQKNREEVDDVPVLIEKRRKSKKDGNVELPAKEKVPKHTEDNAKPPKELSARQRKADQEKPHVRDIPVDVKATRTSSKLPEPEVVCLPETVYHPSARLVFPNDPGKDMKLTEQSSELRAVLNATIERITSSVILVDAYPVMASRTGYTKANMLKVARKIPDTVHIVKRLESDPRMARWLANIGQLDRDQPYRHPAIIAIAKQEWFTRGFAAKYATHFKSTRPKFPENLEMAGPVLALAANAILASLSQYQLSGAFTKIQFKESAYEESYRYHLNLLAKARSDAPTTTARLMHEIYNDIVAPHVKTATLAGTSIISLIEVADSD